MRLMILVHGLLPSRGSARYSFPSQVCLPPWEYCFLADGERHNPWFGANLPTSPKRLTDGLPADLAGSGRAVWIGRRSTKTAFDLFLPGGSSYTRLGIHSTLDKMIYRQ